MAKEAGVADLIPLASGLIYGLREALSMDLVDFQVEVKLGGRGVSTPTKDLWVFNPANDDLVGVSLLMSVEIECPRDYVRFEANQVYLMRIQSPLIPEPPEELRESVAGFTFVISKMEEVEDWDRLLVRLDGKDPGLFEKSGIVLFFSDEHEPPVDLQARDTYNIEEITRFTRRRMPPFQLGEELAVSFLKINT